MTNLHYIADDKLGGVEREYAEVEREPVFGDLVIYDGKVREVTYVGLTAMSLDARIHIGINVMRTLDPTGNVRIDGTVYRMVDRNAAVGEKVLITEKVYENFGEIYTVQGYDGDGDLEFVEDEKYYGECGTYVVLEPINQAPADTIEQSADLSLTESDVRNNPRQVIDLIANMAGRLSKLESRVERLGTANQQAYDIVARNVETWAQEFEEYKQSPAPWATQEQLVELTKQVAEIAGRKQPKDTIVEISEVTAKSALLIAEATELLKRTALTAEERREL